MDQVISLGEALDMADVDEDCTTYIVLAFSKSGQSVFVAGGDIDVLKTGAQVITDSIAKAHAKKQN
jgi:1,4-dihydroxy-2-naphthoyl-CoA synthase